MTKRFIFRIIAIISLCLVITAITIIQVGDKSLNDKESLTMNDEETGELLFGFYYPGTIDAGIIVLEGFGSDHVAMKNMISEFSILGCHIFVFDFSGHGKSGGGLGFDNAQTDKLAKQVLLAKETFKRESGLEDSRIMYIGHSMGARVGLQAATMDSNPIAGMILLGTQVNLDRNVQSSLFTGTTDSEIEWVQNLSIDNPDTNILLISGTWDDILPTKSAQLLFEKLSGQQTDSLAEKITSSSGKVKELFIIKRLFHNYEIFSPKAMEKAKSWAMNTFDALDYQENLISAQKTRIRVTFWFIGIIGLLSSILFGALSFKGYDIKEEANELELEVVNNQKLLWLKLILWFAALPVSAILASVFFVIPISLPVFNLVYVGFIGGYGIVLFILYKMGKMPGVKNKLHWRDMGFIGGNIQNQLIAAGIGVLIIVATSFLIRTGLWFIFPASRIIWLVLFTLFTSLGFYVGLVEIKMINKTVDNSRKSVFLASLIGLTPFFLLTIFYGSIGSISGMISSIYGLIILGLAFTTGYLVDKIAKNNFLTAVMQAVLLQLLVLPQGPLFLPFF